MFSQFDNQISKKKFNVCFPGAAIKNNKITDIEIPDNYDTSETLQSYSVTQHEDPAEASDGNSVNDNERQCDEIYYSSDSSIYEEESIPDSEEEEQNIFIDEFRYIYKETADDNSESEDPGITPNISVECTRKPPRNELFENMTMFEKTDISVMTVLNMLQALQARFNINDTVRYAFFNMLRVCSGMPECLSKYQVGKILNPYEDHFSYVYYCVDCAIELTDLIPASSSLEDKIVSCTKCKREYEINSSSENYFMVIDIEFQLEMLLQDENIVNILRENSSKIYKSNDDSEGFITDVQDTERYRSCRAAFRIVNSELTCDLTFNLNVDGAKMKKNSKKSLHPSQLIINELPPKIRFATIILAGLWYTDKEPNPCLMNLYLKYLVQSLQKVADEGLKIELSNGTTITFRFFLFNCPVDSKARPVMQNRLQYNGNFACSYCYKKGKTVNGYVKYPEDGDTPELRTHARYLQDIKDVERLRKLNQSDPLLDHLTVNGVKGWSVLTELPLFDCVWGFSYEYLHALLLGVVKQLWTYWCSILSISEQKHVEKRLMSLKPSRQVHRLPTQKKGFKSWNASDWEFWHLFYSIVCLDGILESKYLKSYVRLVKSIVVLQSDKVSEIELIECEIDISLFVKESQQLYGDAFMHFNDHLLLHLVESVRKNGQPWASSAFAFESNMKVFMNCVSGSRGVVQQIARKALQLIDVKSKLAIEKNSEIEYLFISELFKKKSLPKQFCVSDEGSLFIGEKGDSHDSGVRDFDRVFHKKSMYQSLLYTRPKKTINYYAQLNTDAIVEIQSFCLIENKGYVNVKYVEVCDVLKFDVKLQHIVEVITIEDTVNKISIEEVKRKVMLLDICDTVEKYICIPLNKVMPF